VDSSTPSIFVTIETLVVTNHKVEVLLQDWILPWGANVTLANTKDILLTLASFAGDLGL